MHGVDLRDLTPLHYAVLGGHEYIIKVLLELTLVDMEELERWALLASEVSGGHERGCKLLLAEGLDPKLNNFRPNNCFAPRPLGTGSSSSCVFEYDKDGI